MQFHALIEHLAFATVLATLSAAVVRLMIAFPILDHPNGRSAHSNPTPRGGGLGVVVAFVIGMLVLFLTARFARIAEMQFLGVILAAVAIAAVALLDDVRNLSARLRLAAQCGAALVAVGSGLVVSRLALPWIGVTDLGLVGVVLTLVWIVGCTNAVNFMDGLDGLVGGTLLLAALALALVAALQGGWFVYAAALFVAAGFAGFLPFNLHPARIFMGDVGSQFAGFIFAVLAVAAARFDGQQVSFLIVPLLIFGLLFDAAFTLARRALMRERLAEGHRTHLYQLAQRSGMPVRAVAATHWGFAAFHGALALAFLDMTPSTKPLVVLPALAVQLLWLGYVLRRMRRAGLGWR
ncbi:undecaprenyl/decaprenyl-phosphate alpha-N-acetylglucosaminyl 1-phosphate transferase [Roseomonas frigidaquae]|uniref:Undecaprenyl/decaprenyl-phosphate alpha-N-acetylglucosaminyl 1-phosphate transferase n=1 Tax=Falsiroseomonas frigidaquae TaxID=487318 RepID=A0ABX1EXZ1_9PROT|nr:undecaprenyl/decaprenyl-phosphate alpha-N-acetylglucosaminyl 1-phosphate transferase [Falsiroseomonas frigidaquae]NKE44909.1 undecaprenyl/decaprenyl-phosphate alpha-N-acetylglucosaminyl 1-phosphate transferase [Falsiroseomonas frigidaquae]